MNRSFIVACSALFAAQSLAVDIAANGGFEIAGADPTLSANWNAFANGAAGTQSVRDPGAPFAGQFAHTFAAFGENGIGAAAGITQNSAAQALPSLAPGTSLSMSFAGNYTLGPGGVGFYDIRILNGVGAIVSQAGLQVINASTQGYQVFNSPVIVVPAFGAAPNDTYSAFVEFSVAAGAFPGSSAQASIDNVVIEGTLVPAGSVTSAFGVAALWLGSRRRR